MKDRRGNEPGDERRDTRHAGRPPSRFRPLRRLRHSFTSFVVSLVSLRDVNGTEET